MDYLLARRLFHVEVHEPLSDVRTVPEAFVHHLWKYQLFTPGGLRTVQGEPLSVIHPGVNQTHAGPDFLHARIRRDGMMWAGAVEIHVTSAEWERHGHQRDARYNSVVLHVTLFADAYTGKLRREDGTLLPEVVLYRYLQAPVRSLLHAYHVSRAQGGLYCTLLTKGLDLSLMHAWIEEQGKERLRQKAQLLSEAMQEKTPEQVLYEALFAGLGYEPNKEAMQRLAASIPLSVVWALPTCRDREALFFGQSGLLPPLEKIMDKEVAVYVADMYERYRRLARRLSLPEPMEANQWQWGRLRPSNFPTIRIAQGVGWFEPGGILHPEGLKAVLKGDVMENTPRLYKLLCRPPSDFWCRHVRFSGATRTNRRGLGRQRARLLMVNVLLPFLLTRGMDAWVWKAVRMWKGDADRITRNFSGLGISPSSALESQGLHHVYSQYCQMLNCLNCAIGRYILQRGGIHRGGSYSRGTHDL